MQELKSRQNFSPLTEAGHWLDPVTLLEQRAAEHWILGWEDVSGSGRPFNAAEWVAVWARELRDRLLAAHPAAHAQFPAARQETRRPYQSAEPPPSEFPSSNPRLLLTAAHPLVFLVSFSAGLSAGYEIFLGNPRWGEGEQLQIIEQIEPTLIIGQNKSSSRQQTVTGIPQKFSNIPQLFQSFPQVFHSFPQAWGNPKKSLKAFLGKDYVNISKCLEPQAVEKVGLFIPTGGSSGVMRFAHHSWQTLMASVQGLQNSNLIQDKAIHSFCLLPLYHVSGLMQFARSLTSGGKLAIAKFPSQKGITANAISPFSNQDTSLEPLGLHDFVKGSLHSQADLFPEAFCLSLVPTQLQRLLQDETNAPWLQRFRMILLGGAPAWPALLDRAQALHLPLAPTYGMTETASQVVTLSPQDFGAGKRGCGQLLPHAAVEICGSGGESLPMAQVGQVRVRSRSLARGYLSLSPATPSDSAENQNSLENKNSSEPPNKASATYQAFPQDETGSYLLTDDLGFFDADRYLHIVGRSSDKIISGGENVFPAEVEAAIRATGQVADVAVCGVPDNDWGERVVAVVVPETRKMGETAHREVGDAKQALLRSLAKPMAQQLSPAKRPKDWVVVETLPRNAQGKLNRTALQAIVRAAVEE